jgi:very-short-patch-repair endonuclease
MQHQATTAARQDAKGLRVGMTDSERRLWSRLRSEQLGVKFRRQHPLGPYVLDFACLAPRLVIEVDGSQHLGQASYDARRDAWLIGQGFQVLRFWANEVLSDTDAVVSRILDLLATADRLGGPPPHPPPRGGGAAPQRRLVLAFFAAVGERGLSERCGRGDGVRQGRLHGSLERHLETVTELCDSTIDV